MSRWFRFYAEAMRNPKVLRLSDKDFRLWVALLAVASENGGAIPPLDDLKPMLKRRLDHLLTGVERLLSIGLIDALATGYEPHNWSKFQYKSDTSNERVARHREKRNVTVTPPEADTDTETPIVPLEGGKPDYAFFGKVVRLKPRDLEQWRRVYHAIPDIEAELSSIDAWLAAGTTPEAKRKAWFHTVAGSLNRKHQEELRRSRDDDELIMPIC